MWCTFYLYIFINSIAEEKVEGCVEPGSALGPDWHRDLNLKGLLGKKNVEIIYETECCNVTLRGSEGK